MADTCAVTHPPHIVLIVEDSADSRDSLRLLLEVEGFRVEAAASALDALQLVTAGGLRPCIVLLDLILPLMDGLTFQQRLNETPGLERVRVVALTGHEGMRRQAEAAGFFRALLKPTDIDALIALVGEHCPRGGEEQDSPAQKRSG